MPTTCNHQRAQGLAGLCDDCRRDYDEDADAYEEYGPHPVGDRNSAELQAEMEAERGRMGSGPPGETDPDMPL